MATIKTFTIDFKPFVEGRYAGSLSCSLRAFLREATGVYGKVLECTPIGNPLNWLRELKIEVYEEIQ